MEIVRKSAQSHSANWREHAACQGANGAAFYPPVRSEKRAAKAEREQRAKEVCASCSVRSECLEQALSTGERHGIWGGLTDAERLNRAS
jgi:WhiB family redox-sensing transcriptional regulator